MPFRVFQRVIGVLHEALVRFGIAGILRDAAGQRAIELAALMIVLSLKHTA